jgi:hypothetical protein
VTTITVVTKPIGGFWMREGYRIPIGKVPLVERFISQEAATSTPITEIPVSALITSPSDGMVVKARSKVEMRGIAWDGGHVIRSVEISADEGKTWAEATLGEDLGVFAFRPWSYDLLLEARGKLSICARAGQSSTHLSSMGSSSSTSIFKRYCQWSKGDGTLCLTLQTCATYAVSYRAIRAAFAGAESRADDRSYNSSRSKLRPENVAFHTDGSGYETVECLPGWAERSARWLVPGDAAIIEPAFRGLCKPPTIHLP